MVPHQPLMDHNPYEKYLSLGGAISFICVPPTLVAPYSLLLHLFSASHKIFSWADGVALHLLILFVHLLLTPRIGWSGCRRHQRSTGTSQATEASYAGMYCRGFGVENIDHITYYVKEQKEKRANIWCRFRDQRP